MFQSHLEVSTAGRGLYLITSSVSECIAQHQPTRGESGLLNLFIQHTSASLLIQENSDPTARLDLQEFFDRLVPENQAWHRHVIEGPDDTVSHLKAALLPTFLQIPVENGKLRLGTWQGIYLFEHRRAEHHRKVLLTFVSSQFTGVAAP